VVWLCTCAGVCMYSMCSVYILVSVYACVVAPLVYILCE